MNAKMLPSVNATEKYTLNVKMPLQSVQQEKNIIFMNVLFRV